jgi:uncharacterized protein
MIQVPTDDMTAFVATARRRRAERQALVAARCERGWSVARRAADLLRREFGATRVEAFGSLVHGTAFHARSDVDLAVWGLPTERFFQAVAAVNDLPDAFGVDLVEVDRCQPALRQVIEREGVAL